MNFFSTFLILFSLIALNNSQVCLNAALKNCSYCDNAQSDICLLCKEGFKGEQTATCTASIVMCKEFRDANTCSGCQDGYTLENNKCNKNADSSSGSIGDAASSGIPKCSKENATDSTKCDQCQTGFELNSNNTSCNLIGCLVLKTGSTDKCQTCKTGFTLSGEVCKEGSSNSSITKFSVAIIISLITLLL